MTRDRLQRVEELFHAALQHDPVSRRAFVLQRAAGDPDLAAEVLSLLEAEEHPAFSEMALQMSESLAQLGLPSLIGQRVGAYVILRELGRGGMGAVYLAERADDAYHKKVAIKFVGAGWTAPLVHARFREERQILANLDHPHIARLLDGGALFDGRPYLVMEFVDGVSLSEYMRQGQPDLESRVRLFRKICEAVQFAHQRLVVHRDLKPANILVQADGTPKLLDFGIARLQEVETAPLTQAGMRMMTPEYSSPELFLGDRVTTATDIYSLGAVLYEIVAGNPPFDLKNSSLRESQTLICETDPERPSARNPALRGRLMRDLDVIVLKALRKQPEDRYASVGDLIADLDHALAGLPLKARHYTSAERLGNFLRRHRIEAIAAALVLASLLGALGVSLRQARIAHAERKRAEQAAAAAEHDRNLAGMRGLEASLRGAEADRQRLRAEEALSLAERRLRDEHHLATNVLLKLNQSLQSLPGATTVRAEAVRASVEYLDRMAQDSSGNDTLRRDLAYAYRSLAEITGHPLKTSEGDLAGALSLYEKSRRIYEDLFRRDPRNPEIRREFASVWTGMGDVLSYTGQLQESAAAHRRAIEILQVFASSQDPGTRDLISAHFAAVTSLQKAGRNKESLDLAFRAQELLAQPLRGADAEDSQAMLRATLASLISTAREKLGDFSGATAAALESVRIREQLHAASPSSVPLARDLMLAYGKVGDHLLAEELWQGSAMPSGSLLYFQRARALASEAARADPADQRARFDLAVSTSRVAQSMGLLHDDRGAAAAYREALEIFEQLAQADPSNKINLGYVAFVASQLGVHLDRTGDSAGMEQAYRRSSELAESLLARNPADELNLASITTSCTGLAMAAAQRGSPGALQLLAKAEQAIQRYRASKINPTQAQIRSFIFHARSGQVLQVLASAARDSSYRNMARDQFQKAVETWNSLSPNAAEATRAEYRELAETARRASQP
jgi:serine/threonine protein kinase